MTAKLMPPLPMHQVRPAGRRAAGARLAPEGTPGYPPGHFTALVREHDWPPQFTSAWPQQEAAVVPPARRARFRGPCGFDGHPLNLPGAVPHVKQWQATEQRRAR